MTPLGRWSAVGALVAGVATVATWNVGASSEGPPQTAAADGADLFLAKGCASCHDGPDSTSRFGGNYPSLADAPTWAGDRRPELAPEEYLTESIAAPGAFISPAARGGVGPGGSMPQLALTAAEIDALVDYLLTASNG